ncbi:DUF1127 domain-containing protein [Aliagarivorans taiwanensis]|uniref:DUF1127 domain-containing protein n=1 Tax=Aliagarivorans taiwanensis TaxID=561966 RepID=UPI0003FC5A18|nr:DUF1127 domain-containing protein [Aliagarivorans taiwanensis]
MSNSTTTIQNNSVFSQAKTTFGGIFQLGNLWLQRQRTRRQLAQLPSYLLRDIGLSEADRYRESNKHFWQN